MKIELYSSPGCKWCNRAKTLMKMANVEYTLKNVGYNISVDEVREMFPEQVGFPIIVIDGEVVDLITTTKMFMDKGLISSKNE